jgi:hypothetical protein
MATSIRVGLAGCRGYGGIVPILVQMSGPGGSPVPQAASGLDDRAAACALAHQAGQLPGQLDRVDRMADHGVCP